VVEEENAMRLDRFTLKAQEVVQTAQQLAERFGNQQIEPEHIVRAILEQKEGVVPPMLGKIGANQKQLIREIDVALEKIPKVSGTGYGQVYISPRTKGVLDKAFQESESMKDEYVGLEHILMAVTEDEDGPAGRILSASGITRDSILKALLDIRGGQRITRILILKTNTRPWSGSAGT